MALLGDRSSGRNKGILSGFYIANPTSYRNEVNMSPDEWSKMSKDNYSIPNSVTEDSIPVSSTAIASARYDPHDNSLNIVYHNGNKEYKFDVKDDLEEWINSPSKGRITNEWKQSHRAEGY